MRAQFFVATRNFTLAGMAVIGLMAGAASTATAEANKNKEPQAVSNQQLIEAHHVLQSVKWTLEKADRDYGGQRAKAVTDLKAAIVRLEKALAFSAAKDQNKP